jgi:hypothetical protein
MAHTFLADGRLLVTGGHSTNFVGLSKASTYNPFTGAWTALPDMNAGRWYPTNTALANGDVLVVSGSISTSEGVNTLPQVFQAATSTWRNLTNAMLSLDLYPMMHLAPNGRVFNSGPGVVTRYLDTSGTGAWAVVANRQLLRDYGSSVLYSDGKILLIGGGNPPTNTAEVIDLNLPSPVWRSVAPMARARRQLNATLLPDGKVLVTGGTSGPGFNNPATPVKAAEMWNPVTETWTTLASGVIPRLYHSGGLLLPDGRVFVTGGDGYDQAEVYSPPYLFRGARPAIATAPASVAYGQTFFVETPNATSITQVTWVGLSSVTHAFNMNQRISRLSFTQTAAVEWAASGVRVNAVAPGAIASSGFDTYPAWMQPHLASAHAAIPAARLGTESEVSAAICFLLSPAAAFISGSVLRVDGAAPNARLASPLSALRDKDAPLPVPWPLDVHDRSIPWHGFHLGRRIHRWGGSKLGWRSSV